MMRNHHVKKLQNPLCDMDRRVWHATFLGRRNLRLGWVHQHRAAGQGVRVALNGSCGGGAAFPNHGFCFTYPGRELSTPNNSMICAMTRSVHTDFHVNACSVVPAIDIHFPLGRYSINAEFSSISCGHWKLDSGKYRWRLCGITTIMKSPQQTGRAQCKRL